jgi:hypothetical protein
MVRGDASPSSYQENSQAATLERLKDSIQEYLSKQDAMLKIQVFWPQFFCRFLLKACNEYEIFLEVLMAVIVKIVSSGI